ncbi:hypothetical protein VCHA51O444_130080 [Vibrio chagasii]|nr:hypothetical protein VCHA51O444_130080 [Vibrio chagasii]
MVFQNKFWIKLFDKLLTRKRPIVLYGFILFALQCGDYETQKGSELNVYKGFAVPLP